MSRGGWVEPEQAYLAEHPAPPHIEVHKTVGDWIGFAVIFLIVWVPAFWFVNLEERQGKAAVIKAEAIMFRVLGTIGVAFMAYAFWKVGQSMLAATPSS
jgi:hypothetical protein